MRTGYFDSEGKCMMISSGAEDPPIPYSFKKEVPDGLGPSTCEFDPQSNLVKHRPRPPLPAPREKPNPRLDAIEARLRALENRP